MMPYKKLIFLCFSFLFWVWAIPVLADTPAQTSCEPSVPSPVEEGSAVNLNLNGIKLGNLYHFWIFNQKGEQVYDRTFDLPSSSLSLPPANNYALTGNYSVKVTQCSGGLGTIGCTEVLQCPVINFSVIPKSGTTGTVQPNQSCTPPLPRIPISVTPDSGGQATQYKLALHWAELSDAQFALYKDTDVTFRILDNTNPVDTSSKLITFTGDQLDPGLNRIKVNKEYTIYGLSNSGVPDYTAYIRLQVGLSIRCTGYEVTPAAIHITTTTCSPGSPGLSKGAKCDPNDQVTGGDPCLKCPASPDNCILWADGSHHCGPAPTSTSKPTSSTGSTGKGTGADCKGHEGDPGYLNTAIGCIPTKPADFIQAVSRLLTGMGGGIAILLMISGAFRMITSAGNPDAVKAGSEQFTSAIIGLLFIIFAVLLLKVIGVDIINIPGFTFSK